MTYSKSGTGFAQRLSSGGGATAQLIPSGDMSTGPAERALLLITVFLLPLEAHIITIPGFSSQFFLYALLAAYVVINRLRCLDRIWMHPVFVAAYVFIGISAALEFASPLSNYQSVLSFGLMIVGATLVASLSRDRAAVKMFLYGYIGAALWLGAVLILTSYGTLTEVTARDYGEASRARAEVFADRPIQGNIGGFAINCVQGGIVALAFALGSASVRARSVFAALGIFCLVASTLPMSRMAIIIAIISCAVVLKAYGIRHGKVWLLAILLAVSAIFLVPDAIWSRMDVKTVGQKEARAVLYEAALQHVDDYWLMGVGAGNYSQKWGFDAGLALWDGLGYRVISVHNAFLQVVINWGLIGLSSLLVLIWLAYRCLPRTYNGDALALGVLGVAVSSLLIMPFISEIYQKSFSLALGILVAYQSWLAPRNAEYPAGDKTSL